MVEENYNMKKIIFGITGLTLGGAERVLVDVANKLIAKYDVTIFTIYAGGELEKELDSKIKLISLFNFKYNDMGKLKKKLIPIGQLVLFSAMAEQPSCLNLLLKIWVLWMLC